MRESVYQADLIKSANKLPGVYFRKIPDQFPDFTNPKTKFTPNKPFDIIGSFRGRSVSIECKVQREKKLPVLLKNQLTALKKFAGANGISLAIYFNELNTKEATTALVEIYGSQRVIRCIFLCKYGKDWDVSGMISETINGKSKN